MKSLNIVVLTVSLLTILSCGNNEKQKETTQLSEEQLLKDYLDENNITEEPSMSGLYVIEIKKGEGLSPTPLNKVKVHYTGYFIDGKKFDSSLDRGKPFEFKYGAGQVIRGWDEAVAQMSVGGKYKLIIPSHLGYGSTKRGPIPANSTLVFEIELIDVEE